MFMKYNIKVFKVSGRYCIYCFNSVKVQFELIFWNVNKVIRNVIESLMSIRWTDNVVTCLFSGKIRDGCDCSHFYFLFIPRTGSID